MADRRLDTAAVGDYKGRAAAGRKSADRPGSEPFAELHSRWTAVHVCRERRSPLPDVRSGEQHDHQARTYNGFARSTWSRDAASGRVRFLCRRAPRGARAAGRSELSVDEQLRGVTATW